MRLMRSSTVIIQAATATMTAMAIVVLVAGCSSNAGNKNSALNYNRSVTDVSPAPIAAAPTPQPINSAPVSDAAYNTSYTDYSSASASNSTGSASAAAGSTYVVRKGDTLYKIAREHYGDAKSWHKIAAANPSAANGAIKVGQKLVLPQ